MHFDAGVVNRHTMPSSSNASSIAGKPADDPKAKKSTLLKFWFSAFLLTAIALSSLFLGFFLPGISDTVTALLFTIFNGILGGALGSCLSYAYELALQKKESRQNQKDRGRAIGFFASVVLLFVSCLFFPVDRIEIFGYAGLSAALCNLTGTVLGMSIPDDSSVDPSQKTWFKKLQENQWIKFSTAAVIGIPLLVVLCVADYFLSQTGYASYLFSGIIPIVAGTLAAVFLYPAAAAIVQATIPNQSWRDRALTLAKSAWHIFFSVILLGIFAAATIVTQGKTYPQLAMIFNSIFGTFVGRLSYVSFKAEHFLAARLPIRILTFLMFAGLAAAGVVLDVLLGQKNSPWSSFCLGMATSLLGGMVKELSKSFVQVFMGWPSERAQRLFGSTEKQSESAIRNQGRARFLVLCLIVIGLVVGMALTHGVAAVILGAALASTSKNIFGKASAEITGFAWRKKELLAPDPVAETTAAPDTKPNPPGELPIQAPIEVEIPQEVSNQNASESSSGIPSSRDSQADPTEFGPESFRSDSGLGNAATQVEEEAPPSTSPELMVRAIRNLSLPFEILEKKCFYLPIENEDSCKRRRLNSPEIDGVMPVLT